MSKVNKLLILLVSFSVVMLTAGYLFVTETSETANYYDILPASTLATFTIPDSVEFKQFMESPEFKELLHNFGAAEEFHSHMAEAKKEFGEKLDMDIEEVYGNISGSVAVGLLDLNFQSGKPGVAIVLGFKGGATTINGYLDKLNAAYAAEMEGATIPTVDIDGNNVYTIENEFFVFPFKNHLVATTSKLAAKRVLSGGDSLKSNPDFARHLETSRLTDGIGFYLNLKPVTAMANGFLGMAANAQMIDDEGNPVPPSPQVMAAKALAEFKFEQIQSFSFKLPLLKDNRSSFFVYAPGYDGFLKEIISGEPVGSDYANHVGAGASNVVSFRFNDPDKILTAVMELASSFNPGVQAMFDGAMEEAYSETGINMREEVIKALGSVMTVSYELKPDAVLGEDAEFPFALFNMMEMDFIWHLNDGARLEKAVRTLIAKAEEGGVEVPVTEYNGALIATPPADEMPMDISFVIYKNTLRFLYADAEAAKAKIDALEAGKTLSSAAWFQSARRSVPASANFVTLTSLKYLKDWSAISSRLLEANCDDVEKKALLNGLSAKGFSKLSKYPFFYSYGTTTKDGFYSESLLPMKDFLYFMVGEVGKFMAFVGDSNFSLDNHDKHDKHDSHDESEQNLADKY